MPHIAFITLAAIDYGLVVIGVIVIGGIISGIANQAKQAKEAEERRRKRREQRAASGESSDVPSLDAIAQQRRRQLEALARQRRQTRAGGGGRSPTSAPQPRAPVAVEEDRRAADVRREQAAQRRQQNAAAEHQRRAEALSERQHQAERVRAQRASQMPRRAPARPSSPRAPIGAPPQRVGGQTVVSAGLGHGATDVDLTTHGTIDTGMSEVHRHVADAGRPPALGISRIAGLNLTGHALRDAIILKEILDKPVAMRNPGESSDPYSL